jgi:hypothetical protein
MPKGCVMKIYSVALQRSSKEKKENPNVSEYSS